MFNYPFKIPNNNIHQIVLHQPDRRQTDFERIEDIGADALAAARDAVEAVAELPYELFKPLQFHERVLRDAVSHRRMVGKEFREAVSNMLEAVGALPEDDVSGTTLRQLTECLTQARTLSNRVADLLASETDIGFHRGIRG